MRERETERDSPRKAGEMGEAERERPRRLAQVWLAEMMETLARAKQRR